MFQHHSTMAVISERTEVANGGNNRFGANSCSGALSKRCHITYRWNSIFLLNGRSRTHFHSTIYGKVAQACSFVDNSLELDVVPTISNSSQSNSIIIIILSHRLRYYIAFRVIYSDIYNICVCDFRFPLLLFSCHRCVSTRSLSSSPSIAERKHQHCQRIRKWSSWMWGWVNLGCDYYRNQRWKCEI